jgi:hypothetical protein
MTVFLSLAERVKKIIKSLTYFILSIQIEILDFHQNLSDQLIGHFPNRVILFNPRLPACKDFPYHNRVNLKLVNKQ